MVSVPSPFRATRPEVVPLGTDDARAALVWSFPSPVAALSSAPVGGGTAALDWALNIGVGRDYVRTDIDDHVAEVAGRLALRGAGAGMLTAADVERVTHAEDQGVVVDATVGLTHPTWAADADDRHNGPGTINVVVQVPVALSGGAAVNAVMAVTEAKTQALLEAGVAGTGTASDAVLVCWPPTVPVERFAGPRSTWGARIARAVHAAVAEGVENHP